MPQASSEQLVELMLQVAKGDESAFRQLAQHITQPCFGLAYRLLSGDRAQAEDVVQEMLIKLWTTAPRWQPTGSVMGYAHRLTYTTAMDALRKLKPTVDAEVEEVGAPETATDKVFNKQRNVVLNDVLKELPERQRMAVLLTYVQEYSQKEVAEQMDTTVKAVESLLVRAKRTLQGRVSKTWLEGM